MKNSYILYDSWKYAKSTKLDILKNIRCWIVFGIFNTPTISTVSAVSVLRNACIQQSSARLHNIFSGIRGNPDKMIDFLKIEFSFAFYEWNSLKLHKSFSFWCFHGFHSRSVSSGYWVAPGICGGNFKTLRLRQNGRHFADDLFKCIFLNGSVWISIKTSPKFVPKDPINNVPALV